MKKKLLVNNQEVEVEIKSLNSKGLTFELNSKEYSFSSIDENALFAKVNDSTSKRHSLFKHKKGNKTKVAYGTCSFVIEDAGLKSSATAAHAGAMVSPMPGKVLKVFKKAGDAVKAGETILVMEAMKMEHAIKAGTDGVIAKIHKSEGDQVEGGVLLVELEEHE